MPLRLGPGPVFVLEWVLTARRWQTYAVRAGFITGLLVSIVAALATRAPAGGVVSLKQMADLGESVFYALVGTQIALVLLAGPAYTAGAICMDRVRGNLTHMLTTDLSSSEIVLGKLCSRLFPVVGLVLAALPVLALSTLLGGIHPEALLGAFVVTLASAVFACTLALTLSVWGRKTHEVLLATYLVLVVLLLLYPVSQATPGAWGVANALTGSRGLNPFFLAFDPYLRPGSLSVADYALYVGLALGVSCGLIVLATARLRAAVRSEGAPPRTGRLAWPTFRLLSLLGPSLDTNPVLWREWHRRRPSWWMRLVWAAYGIGTVVAVVAGLLALPSGAAATGPSLCAFINAFVVSIGLLLVSVTSVTSLQEERARGSLDVLLTTPLPTSTIVWGKWWGAFRAVPLVVLLPSLLAGASWMTGRSIGGPWSLLSVSVFFGLLLAYGAAVTSLGLALATWMSRFGRAVGLSVTIYVAVTAGLIFLLLALSLGRSGRDWEGLAMGSPWFGPGQFTFSLGMRDRLDEVTAWALGWSVVYLGIAASLLAATLATFDACLGRMTLAVPRLRVRRPARQGG